jgi:hypothetical protein
MVQKGEGSLKPGERSFRRERNQGRSWYGADNWNNDEFKMTMGTIYPLTRCPWESMATPKAL